MKTFGKKVLSFISALALMVTCLGGIGFVYATDGKPSSWTIWDGNSSWVFLTWGADNPNVTEEAGVGAHVSVPAGSTLGMFLREQGDYNTGFGVSLPADVDAEDLQLRLVLELDAAAVAMMSKTVVELGNAATSDAEELSWQVDGGTLTVGENVLTLPFSSGNYTYKDNDTAGYVAGTVGGFTVEKPINWFRIYTESSAAADATLTLKSAVITYTAPGLHFGEADMYGRTDTYLQLENGLASAPGTVEVTVQSDATAEHEKTCSQFAKEWMVIRGDAADPLSSYSYATVATATVTESDAFLPQGYEYTTSNMGVLSGGFETPDIGDYAQNELAFAVDVYAATLPSSAMYVELTSSGKIDNSEIRWEIAAADLKTGWNRVVLPLASYTAHTDGSTGAFDYTAMNCFRLGGWGEGVTVGAANVRVAVLESLDNGHGYATSWPLVSGGYTDPFGSYSYATVKQATVLNDNTFLPAGTGYTTSNMGTVYKAFDAVDVSAYTAAQLAFVVDVYVGVQPTSALYAELTSSGKADTNELGWTVAATEFAPGWNRLILPLSKATVTGGAIDYTNVNFCRVYGLGEQNVLGAANAELVVLDSKRSVQVYAGETAFPVTDPVSRWSEAHTYGTAQVVNTSSPYYDAALAPVGTCFATVKISNTYDYSAKEVLATPIDATQGGKYALSDLTLTFKLYMSAAPTDNLSIELCSGGKYDSEERNYTVAADTLVQGWNLISLPLSSGSNTSNDGDLDPTGIDVLTVSGLSTVNGTVYGIADAKIVTADIPYVEEKIQTAWGEAAATAVDMTDAAAVFSNYTAANAGNTYALIVTANGNPALIWGETQYTFDYDLRIGEAVNLAVVKEETCFSLYVNGALYQSTAEVTATAPDFIGKPAHTVGVNPDGTAPFAGTIGNLCLWSDARTAAEIAEDQPDAIAPSADAAAAGAEGLIDAWTLRGNILRVTEDYTGVNGNKLIVCGSRAAEWTDYTLPTEIGDGYYTVAVIPDTQYITRYADVGAWKEIAFWIGNNVESENIVHVIGLGDNTDTNSERDWKAVQAGYDLFANSVSWNSLTGNHDYVWSAASRDTTLYNTYMGVDYITSTAVGTTIGGVMEDAVSGAENAFFEITAGDTAWLILQLEYYPRQSVLDWAEGVLQAHPDSNVILTTHGYLDGDGNYIGDRMAYTAAEKEAGDYIESTEAIYDQLVAPYSNVKMVLSGHEDNVDGKRAIVTNNQVREDGSVVYQMMINAQFLDGANDNGYYGADATGLIALFRFSADGSKVAVQYYCPGDGMTYEPNPNGGEPADAMGPTCTGKSNFVLPLDLQCVHAETAVEGYIAPTCYETGFSGAEVCTVCGATLREGSAIAATGNHVYGTEGTETQAPTLTEPGVMTYPCITKGCPSVLTEAIPTLVTGVIDENGYYREDGKAVPYKGLILVDGYYYYVGDHGKIVKDVTHAVLDTNGYRMFNESVMIESGHRYYFDENGRMTVGLSGVYGGVCFSEGEPVPYAGLIEWEGNTYYISDGGRAVVGRYFVSNLNGVAEKKGFYYFNADGTLVTEAGVYEGYYYGADGMAVTYGGLVEYAGEHYYVQACGKLQIGRYAISRTNGLAGFTNGFYYFGEDGKLQRDVVVSGYYYNADNGRCTPYLGLIEVNGAYYYVSNNGAVVANNAHFYVTNTNGYVTRGFYAFDAEGKMIAE